MILSLISDILDGLALLLFWPILLPYGLFCYLTRETKCNCHHHCND